MFDGHSAAKWNGATSAPMPLLAKDNHANARRDNDSDNISNNQPRMGACADSSAHWLELLIENRVSSCTSKSYLFATSCINSICKFLLLLLLVSSNMTLGCNSQGRDMTYSAMCWYLCWSQIHTSHNNSSSEANPALLRSHENQKRYYSDKCGSWVKF